MTTYFRTTDIVLAAYLKGKGYTIATIEKEGQKGTFVFENVKNDDVATFDLGKAQVEPQAFYNAVRQLTTSVRRLTD